MKNNYTICYFQIDSNETKMTFYIEFSILPSEKVIVLQMKIAPVIITRIYRKDRNDRVGFVTSTPTPVQSTSYLFHGYSI